MRLLKTVKAERTVMTISTLVIRGMPVGIRNFLRKVTYWMSPKFHELPDQQVGL